jgi:hypothetical protein
MNKLSVLLIVLVAQVNFFFSSSYTNTAEIQDNELVGKKQVYSKNQYEVMQAENIPCQSNWNSVTFSCYLKPHHVPTYSFLFDTVLDNAELLSIRT